MAYQPEYRLKPAEPPLFELAVSGFKSRHARDEGLRR
jgi:hypothetical protein